MSRKLKFFAMLVAKLHLSLAIHNFQFSNHVVLHVVCDHAVTTRLFFSFRLFDRGVSKTVFEHFDRRTTSIEGVCFVPALQGHHLLEASKERGGKSSMHYKCPFQGREREKKGETSTLQIRCWDIVLRDLQSIIHLSTIFESPTFLFLSSVRSTRHV